VGAIPARQEMYHIMYISTATIEVASVCFAPFHHICFSTGATVDLMRLRDFQALKSSRWPLGQIWVWGKSSGGSTCTLPRKLFRDFNLLCGDMAPYSACRSSTVCLNFSMCSNAFVRDVGAAKSAGL
jgi:hypothetical protein